jgi:hypothetical protein
MAISLTNPVTVVTEITDVQITNVQLRLYEDGQNLGACSAFVEWRKGVLNGGTFTEECRDNTVIPAADVAQLLVNAQAAEPTELLLGTPTPMDKIFVAIVAYLKSKGKI